MQQGKTKAKLWVPFTPRLRDQLDITPQTGPFIVAQTNGRPCSYQLAWKEIMEARVAIGAQAYDVHALRHTAASELAELGLSDDHIKAITGHSSNGMVRLYAGAAAQKARAMEVKERREQKASKM